jgi:hypothetical protein
MSFVRRPTVATLTRAPPSTHASRPTAPSRFRPATRRFTRAFERRAPGRDPTTSGEFAAPGWWPDPSLRRHGRISPPAPQGADARRKGGLSYRYVRSSDQNGPHRARRDPASHLARLPARLNELGRDPRCTILERPAILRATWDGSGRANPAVRAIVRDFAWRHLPPANAATFR